VSTSSPAPTFEDISRQPDPRLLTLENIAASVIAFSDKRYKARQTGQPFGPITPWQKVNDQWAGSIPDGIHMVLGMPGVGKTAFALQIATCCGCPCLYVTVEMSPTELMRRITARITGTYLGKLKDGSLSAATVTDHVKKATAQCPVLTIFDGTQQAIQAEQIKIAAQDLKDNSPNGFVLVIIDSLHSWADTNRPDLSEYERISAACAELQQLASGLACPVIAIAERNRASAKQDDNQLNAGAGSRKIEYGCETLISLTTNNERTERNDKYLDVILTFTKNRNGTPGKQVPLLFNGALQKYTEA
jgi:replicative DNA helicase